MVEQCLVYCGNRLSREEYLKDEVRAAAMQEMEEVLTGYPSIKILQKLTAAAALVISGPERDIDIFIDEAKRYGAGVTRDNGSNPFRAAGDSGRGR